MRKAKDKKEYIRIRDAKKTDMPALVSLIKELSHFEKAPDAVIVTVNDLIRDGFGKTPFFKSCVAEFNGEVIGMALFYIGYSTWKGKLVYLDDLIVKEDHRNKGIGKLLLDEVIRYSAKEKARVLKWQVLRWNKDAIRFYKRYKNIVFDDEWVDCKMYEKELKKLSSKSLKSNIH